MEIGSRYYNKIINTKLGLRWPFRFFRAAHTRPIDGVAPLPRIFVSLGSLSFVVGMELGDEGLLERESCGAFSWARIPSSSIFFSFSFFFFFFFFFTLKRPRRRLFVVLAGSGQQREETIYAAVWTDSKWSSVLYAGLTVEMECEGCLSVMLTN